MNKKTLVLALLSSLSLTVSAENPSFDYLDIGYSNWNLDGSSDKTDGFEFKGSLTINEFLYVAGDYTNISSFGLSVGFTTVGLGYKYNFTDTTTFFAELDYLNINPESGDSESGFEITSGVRSMVLPKLELKGAIEYLNTGRNDDNTSLVVGGVYSFTDTFASYVDYKRDSDLQRWSIGLRFNF